MSAVTTHTFAQSPAQELLDTECPQWETGTCVLRDANGRICGTCWFTRDAAGGLELVMGVLSAPERTSSDDTKF